jgi:hypothetical protein
MRKSNFITTVEDQRVQALAPSNDEPRRSWIPVSAIAVPALDPAHWSQRKSQANFWRRLERLQRARTIH